MILNPYLATLLAREDQQRQLPAEASQRQLSHRQRPAPGSPAAAGFARRLAAAIARAGRVAAMAPCAIWPATPHRPGEPAGQPPVTPSPRG
jgi:hypothetical protein